MTRYKVELELAVQDENTPATLEAFQTWLEDFLGGNIPAKSGWAVTQHPTYAVVVPWTHTPSKWAEDKRWAAILAKVEEMQQGGLPMLRRGVAMESRDTLYCHVTFYDSRALEEKSLYIISAHENGSKHKLHPGEINVQVEGPYADAGDDYWREQASIDERSDRCCIITDEYVHYTVRPDVKQFAGFGGAEFRFKLLDIEDIGYYERQGIQVEREDESSSDAGYVGVVISHNVWYQGKIPMKHRYLFKPNATMQSGAQSVYTEV